MAGWDPAPIVLTSLKAACIADINHYRVQVNMHKVKLTLEKQELQS